jgi:hypothetical protein
MLNLLVAMNQILYAALLLLQGAGTVILTVPNSGAALRGVVPILGTTGVPGFRSAEISFAYAAEPADTWFLIASANEPVTDGQLTLWDTTTITDGDYTLRLRVFLDDGSTMDAFVTGLGIRNDAPAAAATVIASPSSQPSPTESGQASPSPRAPVAEAAPAPRSSAPTLPPNPAAVQPSAVSRVLLLGGGMMVGALGIFWLTARVRRG